MINETDTTKHYRYEELLQAIDFYTQKFNLDQLSYYAFESTNCTLDLNLSVLFLADGDFFKVRHSKYNGASDYVIPSTKRIREIATLHGDIITSNFERFFNNEDIIFFNMKIVIPLIIKDFMYGFIVSDGKSTGKFEKEDITIAHALMQLMNNSLENSKIFFDFQETNQQLDQKIFNLFSINQSSRALLSVLELNKLYSLSIDIFSELTSSRVTSFGLYDEISENIIVRGYKNVFNEKKFCGVFELATKEYKGYKIVFNYHKDAKLLKELFVNYEAFEALEAEYIILLVRDSILGFVTISTPVNERKYDQSLFELIESLASSTYISIKNAVLFQEVNRQKNIIENKLNMLTRLNLLIKNLNSCTDVEELSDLVVRTLNISLGIKKTFIALHDGKDFRINGTAGFTPTTELLCTNSNWERLNFSGTYYCFTNDSNNIYFSDQLLQEAGESNCLVISPILIDNTLLEEDYKPLGYIVVLQTSESLKEEEILLIETIANSIAPTINHMNSVQQVKREYIINQSEAFIAGLSRKSSNKEYFLIDFHIYYKKIPKVPFIASDISAYEDYEHYYFDNLLLVLSDEELETALFDGKIEAADTEEIIKTIAKL